MAMNKTLKTVVVSFVEQRRYDHLLFRRHFRRMMNCNGIRNTRVQGEENYLAQWRSLYPLVEPYSYRLFSHFCGPTPDIIPEDILHHEIERHLNPKEYWAVNEDKNNFARCVGEALLPCAVAWRQAGGSIVFNASQPTFHGPFILKPAVGTSCGQRIVKLDSMPTEDYLLNYGDDWVLQEAVVQHPLLQRMCSTSVNTLRLAVYRSVVDGQSHVTAAVLRIGREGSIVDNASAGGRYVGIDVETGHLQHRTFSVEGCPVENWNGIDFSQEDITVPSWEQVKQLALQVSGCVPHQHLLAIDIAVRADGSPVIIEYNIGGFSSYFYHFTGQTVFGFYLGEVMRYCSK